MFGKLVSYEVKDNLIFIKFSDKLGIVEVINDDILNLREAQESIYRLEAKKSETKRKFMVSLKANELSIETKNYHFIIEDDFKLKVFKDQKLISYETNIEIAKEEVINHELLEAEGHATNKSSKEHAVMINKVINKDDYLYGLGDKTGYLNKRNYEYEMYNTDDPSVHADNYRALYKSIPFYITFNKEYSYGFFVDNSYKQYYDMGYTNQNIVSIGFDKGYFNYYFIGGENLKEVVSNYTLITGRTPLPARYTLGYHQCRWSYNSEDEILELAKNFRKLDLPCDVLYCDIDYMERFKVFTYDQERFKHFKEMVETLKKDNFKLITIIDPGVKVEAGYDVYEEAIKNNLVATLDGKTYINKVWPGDAVYPTFNNEETRRWWGEKIKFLTDLGVSGIWNDMNEPASFNGPLPANVEFKNGDVISYHDEIHNLYGHYMSMATYDGLKKLTNKRPFVITRAAYAGTQKYSTCWTGDNHSIWPHLQMAIPMLLNLGLSGFSYSGTDVGGFSGNCTKELLCRWVQLGAFTPLFRNHSAMGTRHQEPWCYDEETLEIYRNALKLRYKLIPYLYDLYYEGSLTGLPILRPLVMNYPDDANTYELNDEFLFGDNILVCPVVTQGVKQKLCYLPKGTWYDLETGESFQGGYQIFKTPLNKILAFVKAGAILPVGSSSEFVTEEETMTFEIYPGSGTYFHYQDNGEDFNYENGEYNLYKITHQDNVVKVSLVHQGYKAYQKIILRYQSKEVEVKEFDKEYEL